MRECVLKYDPLKTILVHQHRMSPILIIAQAYHCALWTTENQCSAVNPIEIKVSYKQTAIHFLTNSYFVQFLQQTTLNSETVAKACFLSNLLCSLVNSNSTLHLCLPVNKFNFEFFPFEQKYCFPSLHYSCHSHFFFWIVVKVPLFQINTSSKIVLLAFPLLVGF